MFVRVENEKFSGPAAELARQGAKAFGARIKELRKAQGLNQEEFARRLSAAGRSYHQTTIAKLESGSRPTSVEELYFLAACLNVEVADFFVTDTPDMVTRRRIDHFMAEFLRLTDERKTAAARDETLAERQKEVLSEAEQLIRTLPAEEWPEWVKVRHGEH